MLDTSAVKDMKLTELLKPKYVELNLTAQDKPKLLAEMVDLIAKSGKIKNKRALYTALIEREGLGSTAIGGGIAIPHAKVDAVKEPILAFGRAPAGVDFNSLDGERTYIFFMLISPKEEVGFHLKVLARISHLVKDKFMVGLLRKAKNKEEIIKIAHNIEKTLHQN